MSDGVLDGQVFVSRIVQSDDVVVVVETEPDDLAVLDAVGMLTMAIDTLLHRGDHE